MTLQCLAVTRDATIRQILSDLQAGEVWSIVLYEEPGHIFSAALERLDFLLVDESACGPNYLTLIKKMRKRHPAVEVMVVSGPKSREVLERERRAGVDYYYARPVDAASFSGLISHRLDLARVKSFAQIVGRSQFIEEILESILLVAPTEVPILIQGESGTGKDLIASTIHLASKRINQPFVAINCASLAEGVLESELFGHEKGSFTGAVSQRQGVFERADRGTIFLDEVGEMSANMQVRFLRVLESGEVLRVGGVKSFNVDVRVIAATNRNLNEAVQSGAFRQDIYYRLKGITFHLPPLRERSGDIPVLVDHFIMEANKKHGKNIKGIEAEALRKLAAYPWPGNVRELKNMIDTLVVLTGDDRIKVSGVDLQLREETKERAPLLPVAMNRTKAEAEREMIYASILALHRDVRDILHLLKERSSPGLWEGMQEVSAPVSDGRSRVESLSQMERSAIQEALNTSHGNRRQAADILGISERTLYRKIKEYGLV